MQRMDTNGLSAKETAKGLFQGAVMNFGEGKIAVFGEAAMFSAQRYGRGKTRMGFHAKGAEDNQKFILNVFRWLAPKSPNASTTFYSPPFARSATGGLVED